MEITQYLSPRVQRETDEATAELDSFMLELLKDNEPLITWNDIEFKNDEIDSRPIKLKVKQTKKLKSVPVELDIPRCFSVKSETRTATPQVKITQLNQAFDAYQARLTDNVAIAEDKEAELCSDIRTYDLSTLKVKAVVDWLNLQFTVNPSVYRFARENEPFRDIRKLMKDRGISDNCYVDQSRKDENIFVITLHDIKRLSDLEKTTSLLAKQYGSDCSKMRIVAIELATDWYGSRSEGLLTALHKSAQYGFAVDNHRIYKERKLVGKKIKFNPVPSKPCTLLVRFINGYNMGMGHRDEAPVRYHAYCKTTDNNGIPLPHCEHRLRFEVTLQGIALNGMDNTVGNLRNIIKFGFSHISFTRPKQQLTSQCWDDIISGIHNDEYLTTVKPYGQSVKVHVSDSRNKRTLPENIKTFSDLNSKVRDAVKNLVRFFS